MPSDQPRAPDPERPAWRRRAAAAVLVGALTFHGFLLVNGGSDVHKRFGFRPFNESDTWQADISRITADGERLPIDDDTWPYDWDDLVGNRKLQRPDGERHANAGADAVLDLLQRALDWAVDHTPDDPDTVAFEAEVTVRRNGRDPEVVVLVSHTAEDDR